MEKRSILAPRGRTGLDLFCPHKPWPKQQFFLDLECEEALFGGAAGGGKSDVMLMDALQYAHLPDYAGLILRRDSKRMELAGGILARAQEWLHGKANFNGTKNSFHFPNGARLDFGYIDNPQDRFRYQGTEYDFIGWDELTEFALTHDDNNPYTFLFRSLRASQIPLRMRGTSNPGNVGHEFVKARFITKEAEDDLRNGCLKMVYYSAEGTRAFVPSLIKDNPAVNETDYRKKLSNMSPLTRERMMNGDWSIMPEGLIKLEWLRHYTMRGQHLVMLEPDGTVQRFKQPNGTDLSSIDERECRRIMTIDSAGTSADKAKEAKGKSPSWSVAEVWDILPNKFGRRMCLRHVWRARVGYTDLKESIRNTAKEWRPSRLYVEDAHLGPALFADLRGELPIQTISPAGKDKVTRATDLLNMLEAGEVYLPDHTVQGTGGWCSTLTSEWLSWQGLDDDTADQVDTAAYAAMEVCKGSARVLRLATDPRKPLGAA